MSTYTAWQAFLALMLNQVCCWNVLNCPCSFPLDRRSWRSWTRWQRCLSPRCLQTPDRRAGWIDSYWFFRPWPDPTYCTCLVRTRLQGYFSSVNVIIYLDQWDTESCELRSSLKTASQSILQSILYYTMIPHQTQHSVLLGCVIHLFNSMHLWLYAW